MMMILLSLGIVLSGCSEDNLGGQGIRFLDRSGVDGDKIEPTEPILVGEGFEQSNDTVESSCSEVDICKWDKNLPLGSENLQGTCSELERAGLWSHETSSEATCMFTSEIEKEYLFYASVDNDIEYCLLNGEEVVPKLIHEGCASQDPRDEFTYLITAPAGENELKCVFTDRGTVAFFDACVVEKTREQLVDEVCCASVNTDPAEPMKYDYFKSRMQRCLDGTVSYRSEISGEMITEKNFVVNDKYCNPSFYCKYSELYMNEYDCEAGDAQ